MKSPLVQLHVAVLLFGISGLMAKLIQLPAMDLVLGRTMIGALALAVIMFLSKPQKSLLNMQLASISQKLNLVLSGVVLAVHWWSFFYAIQLGGVGVALVGFSAFPIFVLLFENGRLRQPFTLVQVLSTCMVVVGLWLVAPEISWQSQVTQGLVWGIISGLLFAVLAMQNQALVPAMGGMRLGMWQQAVAALCSLPVVLLDTHQTAWTANEIGLLVVLGVLLTAIPHSLFIHCLKSIKAHTAAIITSLEPVYGIAFAWWLLAEIPAVRTLLGAAIILLAVVLVQLGKISLRLGSDQKV